ncbi:MAG: Abi family protein [Fluviicola sp.]
MDQLIQLKTRGLIIQDDNRVISYLRSVGYYRLTGYMFHLQTNDGNHTFQENTSFDDVILHYKFDNKLRILLLSYLDRIEVALRARLIDNYSINLGFFWYVDSNYYENKNIHDIITSEVISRFNDPQERFLRAYKSKYTSETYPPANMGMEILSFGKLSKMFEGLINDSTKLEIAKSLTLPNAAILASWLNHLTNVRNACAHHSRIWNRKFSAERPVIPSRKDYKFNGDIPENFNTTLYGVISIIIRLLSVINPNNSFEAKVLSLFQEYPQINFRKMGFPNGWEKNPAWKPWTNKL